MLLLLFFALSVVALPAKIDQQVVRVTYPLYDRTTCKMTNLDIIDTTDAWECRQVLDFWFEQLNVDVWGVVKGKEGNMVDIRLNGKQLNALIYGLQRYSEIPMQHDIIVESVQGLIEKSNEWMDKESFDYTFTKKKDWFKKYHGYTDIFNWYSHLAESNPNFLTFLPSIGQTHESRDIFALQLRSNSTGTKRKVWIQAGIHAREWISHAVLQYLTQNLLKETELLNHLEFVLIPIVNPDGYVYSWERDRLWRKNRRQMSNGVGVDLNRNFPEGFNSGGSSSSPFSEIYQGPSPASEPETQTLIKHFTENKIDLALDLHAYSQLILRPYGYKEEAPPNEPLAKKLGDVLQQGIHKVHGKNYHSQREIDLYQASGTDEDFWASQGSLAYTIELRPSASEGGFGGDGFILPPSQIIPTAEEIFNGLKEMFASWLEEQ